MIGRTIYGHLDNLTIGNGEVYNFIDYIGEIHPSQGIQMYSRSNGFLEANIYNNYDGGKFGRYNYGRNTFASTRTGGFDVDRIYGLGQDKINGTDGVKMENNELVAANLTQDRVGEYYSVNPTATNQNLHFISEYEFGDMCKLIRDNILTLNINDKIFKTRYLGNFDKFVASGMTTSSEIGTDIVNTSFRKEYQRYYIKRKPLDETSIENRNELLKYRGIDGYHDELGVSALEYGDIIEITKPQTQTWGRYDILSSYKGNRDDLLQTSLPSFPYGIKRDTDEIYSIGEKNIYSGITLDPDISNGSLIQTTKNGRTYYYYQEAEGGNMIIKNHSTHDSFVPQTSSMDGSSRLLQKTNELFKNAKINNVGTLINRFHTDSVEENDLYSSFSKYGLSRGRNLLKKNYVDMNTGYSNPYCRVWTASHQYSKMKDLIRPFGGTYDTVEQVQRGLGKLRPNGGATHLSNNTVLQDNGFVRITSQHLKDGTFEFNNETSGMYNLSRYMFSIENLAWKDSDEYHKLPLEQRGPNGGRIMWFPPYNLSFNENVNVAWKDHDFIGRGEKIYTYTNTERNGTLDFTILIDHPSAINRWRGSGDVVNKNEAEQDLLRFFAGCGPEPVLSKSLKPNEEPDDDIPKTPKPDTKNPQMDTSDTHLIAYYLFFPNNFSGVDYKNANDIIDKLSENPGYEMTEDGTEFTEMDKRTDKEKLKPENRINYSYFGINNDSGFRREWERIKTLLGSHILKNNQISDSDEMNKPFSQLLRIEDQIKNDTIFGYDATKYEISSIDIYGFASSHGYNDSNEQLFSNRQQTMISIIQAKLNNQFDPDIFNTAGKTGVIKVAEDANVNEIDPKIGRSAVAVFHIKLIDGTKPQNDEASSGATSVNGETYGVNKLQNTTTKNELVINKVYEKPKPNVGDEYLYFAQIEENNNIVYKNIVDKIKFFDPAFHSLTPEGFNGRLSFLQQCTRQGPTQSREFSNMAWNLAFGMQPYCILRIGDFFNTKICITSMSVTYDNDGIRWDLNPEGAGVQPMMAKVSLTFNFVGGQDIGGPVEELQNAISENYYANTSVFNSRATKINRKTK